VVVSPGPKAQPPGVDPGVSLKRYRQKDVPSPQLSLAASLPYRTHCTAASVAPSAAYSREDWEVRFAVVSIAVPAMLTRATTVRLIATRNTSARISAAPDSRVAP
jgi:hypothetical protein